MNKKIFGGLVIAASIALSSAANAQALRLNLGGPGLTGTGLSGISATALGGAGSLANVNLGLANASVGLNNGVDVNLNLGRYATGANPVTPTTLGGDSFFSTNFSSGGGGGGGGMQLGDTGFFNGQVQTQDARRRVVNTTTTRKLKRRVSTIIRRT